MAESQPTKSLPEILDGMSEEHRRMIAEGVATLDRFSAKPVLKDGKAHYKGNTVAAAAHVKAKRGS
jgi:hypothetical protein